VRYNRTIKQQLAIVEGHARLKVDRLVRLSKQAKRLMERHPDKGDELNQLLCRMYMITEDLKPVESWVKQSWPEITVLYDTIQSSGIKEVESDGSTTIK
jgi:hypothetical protein